MDYRQLMFYQKAREVLKLVDAETKTWAKSMQAWEIARQLFRAATSVGANIAEGYGRHEGLEYVHYLKIAQGSANEVDHWLHATIDCNVGDEKALRHIGALNNETRKMLATTIVTLQKQSRLKTVHEPFDDYTLAPSPLTLSTNDDFDKE